MTCQIGAIHQPPFLTWLGYLETMLATTDTNTPPVIIVNYSDVAYKKGDYLNRNRLIIAKQARWVTIPVEASMNLTVREIKVAENFRPDAMLKAIKQSYSKARFFNAYFPAFEKIMLQKHAFLIDFNMDVLRWMRDIFRAKCVFVDSHGLGIPTLGTTKRLTAICEHLGINIYYSGSGTKSYVNFEEFEAKNIRIVFHDYQKRHMVYPQVNNDGEFIPNLAFLDALFNIGPEAIRTELIRSAQAKLQEYGISL